MTAHILGRVGQALGLFALAVFVFLFVKSLFEKRRRARTDRSIEEAVQSLDTASVLIRRSFEIDVKNIAIESLLEELRRSEKVSLKFAECLWRLAKDFEHLRAVGEDVLQVLSAEIVGREQLLKARALLRAEQEKTQSVVELVGKETRA